METNEWFNNLTRNITASDSVDLELFHKLVAIVDILFIPFILGGNILVLLAVYTFENLQTVTNYLVVSLAVADLLVGIVTIPIYAVFYFEPGNILTNKYACLVRYAFVIQTCGASLLNLLFISIDRYIAIVYCLRYNSLVTPFRVKLTIVLIWTYMTITSLLPIFGWNNWTEESVCDFYRILPKIYVVFAAFMLIAVCLILSTLLYIRIFVEAKRQHRKILQTNVHRSPEYKRKMERDLKSAKVMAIVLLMFVIFWLPYMLIGPLRLVVFSNYKLDIIKNFALCLSFSNSMVNPIIYALLRQEFRHAFKKVLYLKLIEIRRLSNATVNVEHLSVSSSIKTLSSANLRRLTTSSRSSVKVAPSQSQLEEISLRSIPSACDNDVNNESKTSPVRFQ